MSVLLIDAGNTRLKWQWRGMRNNADVSRILSSGSSFYMDSDGSNTWLAGLPNATDVDRVVVACVRELLDVRQMLAHQYGDKLYWLNQPLLNHANFIHCYAEPLRLGVDRWLALLGARTHFTGALIVADAGTAFTIDVLGENNTHEGGFIVPGVAMAQEALFKRTERVRPFVDEQKMPSLALGRNTVNCVDAGVRRQLKALLQSVMMEYPAHRVLVTGGDGVWLAQATNTEFYPDLVFDGMESLCAGSF